jgi:hypothetical protein
LIGDVAVDQQASWLEADAKDGHPVEEKHALFDVRFVREPFVVATNESRNHAFGWKARPRRVSVGRQDAPKGVFRSAA